jgi:RNA polymerase sigma factor (sigma-70 family)
VLVTAIDDGSLIPRQGEVVEPVVVSRRDGFELLYRDEYEPMLRVAYLLLHSRDLAEEAVHDAFAKVFERWSRVGNPGGYLRTYIVNRCRDVGRRGRLEQSRVRSSAASTDLQANELFDALGRLPIKRRAAVVLRYYEGLSEPETAAVLNVPVGTVKSLVNRGLAQLRREVPR